jgi:hypothetical protein
MVIEHDGTPSLIYRRRPNIKYQAILGEGRLVDPRARLKRRWAWSEGVPNTGPGFKRRRLLEPIFSRD